MEISQQTLEFKAVAAGKVFQSSEQSKHPTDIHCLEVKSKSQKTVTICTSSFAAKVVFATDIVFCSHHVSIITAIINMDVQEIKMLHYASKSKMFSLSNHS